MGPEAGLLHCALGLEAKEGWPSHALLPTAPRYLLCVLTPLHCSCMHAPQYCPPARECPVAGHEHCRAIRVLCSHLARHAQREHERGGGQGAGGARGAGCKKRNTGGYWLQHPSSMSVDLCSDVCSDVFVCKQGLAGKRQYEKGGEMVFSLRS